jgi:hypothetical protein
MAPKCRKILHLLPCLALPCLASHGFALCGMFLAFVLPEQIVHVHSGRIILGMKMAAILAGVGLLASGAAQATL